MNFLGKNTWNEFKWQEVLDEIDKGVAVYFNIIPAFIGLPAEQQIISENMKTCRKGDEYYQMLNEILETTDEQEENDDENNMPSFPPGDSWELRKGARIFRETESLATEFACLYSENESFFNSPDCLAALAYYGLILRDAGYIIETPDELQNLALAFAKRIYSNTNKLLGILKRIPLDTPYAKKQIEKQISALLAIMDETVDLCYLLKNQKK